MRAFRVGFIVCLAGAVLGCSASSQRASVTGTITCKGQPVKAGTVFFYYEQGGTYQAELKPDGYYQFMDVPTGNVKVVVKTEAFNPEQKPLSYTQQQKQFAKGYGKGLSEYDAMMGKGRGEKKEAAPAAAGLPKEQKEALAKVYVKLDPKYASEKTTPLTYTVERGRQVKGFDVSD
jgi:hypothetical protein